MSLPCLTTSVDGAPSSRARGAAFGLVTGGKGGVGKTTIAVNLGVALARSGRRVLLVDLDLGLANLHVLCGLEPKLTLEDFLVRDVPLERCVAQGPGGTHVLCAGNGTHEMGRPDEERRRKLFEALARLAPSYDLVLGDAPAGIGPDVLAITAAADFALVVTTPEPAAMTDAYGVLKALDAWSAAGGTDLATPELAINLASGPEEARSVAERLRGVSERFLGRTPRLAGWLPTSSRVRRSVAERRPFALADPSGRDGGGAASACLAGLAKRVARLGEAFSGSSDR